MDSHEVNIPSRQLTPIPTAMNPGGTLRRPIKCLMCDIYGTLFISGSGDIGTSRQKKVPYPALESLLTRYGIERSVKDLLDHWHALIEKDHARSRARGTEHPEVKIDEIWAGVLGWQNAQKARPFASEFEMIMNPVWPMPGLAGLLKRCRDDGILLGIISNAQFFTLPLFHQFMNGDAQSLGFHHDLIFLSYRHGVAKPSGKLFQLAVSRLRQMGIDPNDSAYIGNDMRNDIAPARAAGFQTILFAGDARSLRLRADAPQCAGVQPDLVVTRLDQV